MNNILKCTLPFMFGLGGCLVMAGLVFEYDEDGKRVCTYNSDGMKGTSIHKYADGKVEHDLGNDQYIVWYPNEQQESNLFEEGKFKQTYILVGKTTVEITNDGTHVEQTNPDGTIYSVDYRAPENNPWEGDLCSQMVWIGNIDGGRVVYFDQEYVGEYRLWKLVPKSE